jgi:glycosyltransferase involved in cell wall biosynthesis
MAHTFVTLSILIPAYNNRSGLLRVLNAVLGGDDVNLSVLEIIVGDDSSSPLLSPSEVDGYRSLCENFCYLFNSPSNGAVPNWNSLILRARGDYYWLCHHDDYYDRSIASLQDILNLLSSRKISVLVFPVFKILTSLRSGQFFYAQRHTPPRCIVSSFFLHPSLFFFVNTLGPPSALIIKSDIPILYDEALCWYVDVLFYYNLFSVVNSDSILLLSSPHRVLTDPFFPGSITRSIATSRSSLVQRELSYLARTGIQLPIPVLYPMLRTLIRLMYFLIRITGLRIISIRSSRNL